MAIAGFRILAAMSSMQDSAAEATMLTRLLPSDEPWNTDHADHLRRAALEGAAGGGMHDVGRVRRIRYRELLPAGPAGARGRRYSHHVDVLGKALINSSLLRLSGLAIILLSETVSGGRVGVHWSVRASSSDLKTAFGVRGEHQRADDPFHLMAGASGGASIRDPFTYFAGRAQTAL